MLQWLRNLWTGNKSATSSPAVGRVRGRYDNAQTSDENSNRWANTDLLSPKSANSFGVRQTLRRRSRYEVANNCYARGMILTLANDLVGKGPRLKLQTGIEKDDRQTERAWGDWVYATGLAEKLHVSAIAKKQDGEAFGLFYTNPLVDNPVRLDVLNLEADQITTPMPYYNSSDWVDGLTLDERGNVTGYKVLDQHPGDSFFGNLNPLRYRDYPRRLVMHWYRKDRPGQVRGIPEITPALHLFIQLRLFTLATLTSAETAAQFVGVLKSISAADVYGDSGSTGVPDAFDPIDFYRGQLMTLPKGYDLGQMKAEHPATTYPMFKEELLKEIARCLNVPFNVASGDSSKYNYSSSKLDHILYGRSMQVERAQCERVFLDRIFRAWLEEAILVSGLLPASIRAGVKAGVLPQRAWGWDPVESADPLKDAKADQVRLDGDTITLQEIAIERGGDYVELIEQRSREKIKAIECRAKELQAAKKLAKQYGVDEAELTGADDKATPKKAEASGGKKKKSRPERFELEGVGA